MPRTRFNITLILALHFHLFLGGQPFNFRNFSVQDGLGQSQAVAILEDSRGYIWIGTQGGGLSRYDGLRFRTFTTADGLANNYINALFEGPDGLLWIGTRSGLVRYDGLRFRNYSGALPQSINAITAGRKEAAWLGTEDGLYQLVQDRIQLVVHTDAPVLSLLDNGASQIWIGTQKGLFWFEEGEIQQPGLFPQALREASVSSLLADTLGQVWVGTYGRGLFLYSQQEFRLVHQNINNFILSLAQSNDGQVWAGTLNAGIFHGPPDGRAFSQLTQADGLCSNHIRAIAESRWGDFWFGSSGGGISQYSGRQFLHYTEADGLPANHVYALAVDTAGQLLASCGNGKLALFNDSTFQLLPQMAESRSRALLIDGKGRLWLGTEGQGLLILQDSMAWGINRDSGLVGNWIRAMVKTPDGAVWVGAADGGLSRVAVDSLPGRVMIQAFGTADGLKDYRIYALHFDGRQRFWYGTPSGAGWWEKGKRGTFLTQEEGLAPGAVRAIAQDSLGNIWVGAAGGLARISCTADSCLAQAVEGLTSNNIYLLACSRDGQLWVGTQLGVDRLTLDAAGNVKAIRHYGRAEGFTGIETSQNAVLAGQQGNLWFGTVNGLMQYNPRYTIVNATAPPLHFTGIRLFYEPLERTEYARHIGSWHQLRDTLVLPYHQNHLEFEFQGINPPNPEKIQYQWRLLGLEESWSPLSGRNNVMYANLAPGLYTFQVIAYNEEGVPSPAPLEGSFLITPPFWATWWFRLSAIGAGLLAISLLFWWRIRRLQRKSRIEKERLEMEKRLLELEQKALQLQMNPHFIFNAINSIQSLIVQQEQGTARQLLSQFARLMRAILYNSRKELVPLEEELAVLENYLSLERFIRGELFDYEIIIDESIDPEDNMLPPMLIQPFLENAILHGIAPAGKKGRITLVFQRKGPILECRIQDNGIGIEESRKRKKDGHHVSTALQAIRERLFIMNMELGGYPPLEINEMKRNGSVAGTEVLIRLPFRE